MYAGEPAYGDIATTTQFGARVPGVTLAVCTDERDERKSP